VLTTRVTDNILYTSIAQHSPKMPTGGIHGLWNIILFTAGVIEIFSLIYGIIGILFS